MDKGFLPPDYKVPKTGGGYTKFQDGPNKVRFLSSPILGFEYWNTDNKPVRARERWESIPTDARIDDGAFKPKHFWALVVFNYATKAVEILEITQASIQTQITDLITNEDWGDPREYDLTINRKGQKLDTEYTVQPSPAKPLGAEVKAAFEAKPINLEALFDGANPFEEADGVVAEEGESLARKNRPAVVGDGPGF